MKMVQDFSNERVKVELSNSEFALINTIRQSSQNEGIGRVRTGRVSVAELMGFADLPHPRKDVWNAKGTTQEKYGYNERNQRTMYNQNMNPRYSYGYGQQNIHDASNQAMISNVRPLSIPQSELLRMLPPLAPMYPIGPCEIQQTLAHLSSNMQAQGYNQQRGRRCLLTSNDYSALDMNQVDKQMRPHASFKRPYASSGPPNSANFRNIGMKTQFFAPYMSLDAVNRGLETGYLYKGSLRIDSFNYEQAVVDIGDISQELLILGVQDRNRALHGDIVAVRIKARENWVVLESMYNAWRNSMLKDYLDENHGPLAIPPIERENSVKASEECKVCEAVESKDGEYSRKDFISIAIRMEMNRNDMQQPIIPDEDLVEKLEKLAIAKKPSQSVLADTCSSPNDFLSTGQRYRTLSAMPSDYWGMPEICLQKTAEVVFVLEQQNCRAAVGLLKRMDDGNPNYVLFSPNDSKLPRMMIPAEQAPVGFFDKPNFFTKFIYGARIMDWYTTDRHARGKLYKSLGVAGDIDAETEGLLLASNVDTREFSPLALQSLPIMENLQWHIDQLGIHVADVSHFVHENTELDHWAALRSVAVCLNHKTIPMLPTSLTEDICSFKNGMDRLAMSIVWSMDESGTIVNEWMGRSIVRSNFCFEKSAIKEIFESKEEAENPEEKSDSDSIPVDMKSTILDLKRLSNQIRNQRNYSCPVPTYERSYNLVYDSLNGYPSEATLPEICPIDQMLDEFRILANSRVAQKLLRAFPKIALLRRHFPPKQKALRDLLMKINLLGIEIEDISPSSLNSILHDHVGSENQNATLSQVLVAMLKRVMPSPVYFCPGSCEDPTNLFHFAKGVEPYTHFTSPISRYADIMVHRLLSSALGYSPPPTVTPKIVENLSFYCNEKKMNGESVSHSSNEMFFSLFLKNSGPLMEKAVVIDISPQSLVVFVLKYGITKSIPTASLSISGRTCCKRGYSLELVINWKPRNGPSVKQNIRLFSVVNVALTAMHQSVKYAVIVKPPTLGEEEYTLSDLNNEVISK